MRAATPGFILFAILTIACAAPAAAQTTPATWSGPYVGLDAAGVSTSAASGSSTSDFVQVSGLFLPNRGVVIIPGRQITTTGAAVSTSSGTFSGRLGYARQFGRFVAALQGEAIADTSGTLQRTTQMILQTALRPEFPLTSEVQTQVRAERSVLLRLGTAAGRSMIYATAGVSHANVRVTQRMTTFDPGGLAFPFGGVQVNFGPDGPTTTAASDDVSRSGFTAGVGGEWRVSSHIGVGIEYRQTNFGAVTLTGANQTISTPGATLTDASGAPTFGFVSALGPVNVNVSSSRIALQLTWHAAP